MEKNLFLSLEKVIKQDRWRNTKSIMILEIFTKSFGLEKIAYRWSAQDLITLDKIPYIGEITSDQKTY